MRPSIAVEESVIQLGSNLRSARLRRRMPQSVIPERAYHSIRFPKLKMATAVSLLETLPLCSTRLACPLFCPAWLQRKKTLQD